MESFWQTIKKPIIGLSPMDGITDPAFRSVVDEVGYPSILYTEFVSAEGLSRNPKRLLRTFTSHKTDTPLIGQLFGSDPIAMGEASAILLEKTGVSGIDINMGCPQKDVVQNGSGAALITNPTVAKKLIAAVHQAIRLSKKTAGLSVKTRIAHDLTATKQWIATLLETPLNAIAIHGRTLKQVFSGSVQWENLQEAANLANKTTTLLLGNGDIASLKDAHQKAKTYTPDGVLIGRASFGNPWVFSLTIPDTKTRLQTAIRHVILFTQLTPDANPLTLRKHLGWYIKGLPDASSIREHIMKLSSPKDMLDFLSSLSYSE